MSGTALTPWGIISMDEARKRTWKLAEIVGCVPKGTEPPPMPSLKEDEKLVECLSVRPTEELVTKAAQVLVRMYPEVFLV